MKAFIALSSLLTVFAVDALAADVNSHNSKQMNSASSYGYYQQDSSATGQERDSKWYSTNQNHRASGKSAVKDQARTESDHQVNQRIRKQLKESFPEGFDAIILRTSDGVVVLDGFVLNGDEQKKLLDEVEQVNGVKHVVNNTKLKQ